MQQVWRNAAATSERRRWALGLIYSTLALISTGVRALVSSMLQL